MAITDTTRYSWFETTHWSVVLQAQDSDSPAAAEAIRQLCETYWRPVHTYIRQRGFTPHDADDLTQQFFAQFLAKAQYRFAHQDRGRFRSFLRVALKRFLINQWERASALKRGGGQAILSLDAVQDGSGWAEPVDERSADRLYDEAWALTILERVQRRLQQDYAAQGKAERFAILENFLPGEESPFTYAEAAARLGAAEGTVKSDVHRLKRRYRELLREEVAQTVATPTELDGELRYLVELLG